MNKDECEVCGWYPLGKTPALRARELGLHSVAHSPTPKPSKPSGSKHE